MNKQPTARGGSAQRKKLVAGVQAKLQKIKMKVEKGDTLTIKELSALNDLLRVTDVVGAAW